MKIFSIAEDNKVAAYASEKDAPAGTKRFGSEEELAALAERWPASRLVEVWKGLPGATPVRKFTDRKTAVRRIWRALDGVAVTVAQPGRTVRPQRKGPATQAGSGERRATPPKRTKAELILALLRRPSGATLQALMQATQWQAHSVRGFLSGHVGKKLGLSLQSFERDGQRVYALKA